MLKAYETEGHNIYWQVFQWVEGETVFVGDVETLNEVMGMARQKQLPLTLYTLDWAFQFEEVEV